MSTTKKIALVLGVPVLLAVTFLAGPTLLDRFSSGADAAVTEFVLSPKTVSFRVDATGTLRATSVQNFGAPPAFGNYWQFQIVGMAPDGHTAKKGDVLITFDAQKVRDDLQRLENELDQATKELDKTRARVDLEKQDLLWRLAAAENNYEKFKVRQGISAAIESSNKIELDALALEQARREFEAIKERLEWHQKSSQATLQIIESKRARAENQVREIQRGIEGFQAKADRDGVVVYRIKWNGEKYRVGENSWSGESVLEIPDLNTLVAEAFVPEVDLGKVKIGQRAQVTIDAFPGKSYSGRVVALGKLVRPKSWDIPNKVLDVQIALDQLDISLMRPGMSVRVQVETASLADCLAVPLRAVRTTAAGSMVKLRTGVGWEDRQVKLGASNSAEVVVQEGLKPGDRIAGDYVRVQ